ETRVVAAAIPAYADPLSLLPSGDLGAQFIDDAGNFVARNPRILNSRREAFFHKHVAVANAAGLHFDPDLSSSWRRNLALDNLEIRARSWNLHRFHRFDSGFHKCCHSASSRIKLINSARRVEAQALRARSLSAPAFLMCFLRCCLLAGGSLLGTLRDRLLS